MRKAARFCGLTVPCFGDFYIPKSVAMVLVL